MDCSRLAPAPFEAQGKLKAANTNPKTDPSTLRVNLKVGHYRGLAFAGA